MLKYYGSALIFTVVATVAGFLLGGPGAAYLVLLLGVLEISVSFDNAVVNARILRNWDPLWRNRFLLWGMPVAVFGMRLAVPLIIVAVMAGLGPVEVVRLAIRDPKAYADRLTSAHAGIAAFGGAFLAMVFLDFTLDSGKDSHWLAWLEKPLQKLGRLRSVQSAITLVTVLLVSRLLPSVSQMSFVVAGVWGFVTYTLVQSVGGLAGCDEEGEETSKRIVRQGIQGLLYLELLDSAFSFDGVIGSFALSNDIFVIALGLGIGAMFVRSMTLHLVDRGALEEYRYLEHGAFWAIGALTVIMFAGAVVEIPETISGSIGAVLIVLSFWSSLVVRRKRITTAQSMRPANVVRLRRR
jgi:hypothetical protein